MTDTKEVYVMYDISRKSKDATYNHIAGVTDNQHVASDWKSQDPIHRGYIGFQLANKDNFCIYCSQVKS